MRSTARAALVALALSIVLGSTGAAAAALEPVDEPLAAVEILATAIDLTLADTAVTDDALRAAGITSNAVPTLLEDPSQLVVDDDLAQCPNAEFTTINAAVAAAPPFATIRVCPGLYKESVLVAKPGLEIRAPRHQGQATECSAKLPPDPTRNAILTYNAALNGGNPSVGFDLRAADVAIEGFTIQPDPAAVAGNGVGILTDRSFGGYEIRHNVIQQNTIGVYFNSAGESFVRENCLRANNLGGAAAGNGVYSDQGLVDSSIENNVFTGHTNASVVVNTFLSTPPQNIRIVHNESIDDSTIVVFDSENVTIDYNRIVNPSGSGIFLFNVEGGSVQTNHLEGGPAAGTGIALTDSRRLLVKSNKATAFLRGLRLRGASSANNVETNRLVANRTAGLQAIEQANNNQITENHMRDNGVDCSDRTAGAGTSGTANFWINDTGFTEDRPGICKRATFVP